MHRPDSASSSDNAREMRPREGASGSSTAGGRRSRRGRGVLAIVLALTSTTFAACGPGSSPDSTPEAAAAGDTSSAASDPSPSISPPAPGPSPAPDSVWTTSVTNVGLGLTLSARGAEILRFACVRESREMTVDLPGFTSIGSEERLSVGIDDEPHVFVAQVTPPPPAGVHATRAIDNEVLNVLESARTLSAYYGAQASGPHTAPDPAVLEDFVSGCRRVAAR